MGYCMRNIERTLATSQREGRLGTKGTDNQTARGLTQRDTLGQCQLYIQRLQATSQTGPGRANQFGVSE